MLHFRSLRDIPVLRDVIYHSQKVKAARVLQWMNGFKVVHPFKGILFSLKEKGHSDKNVNMDEP